MVRVNVYEIVGDDRQLAGWFEWNKAERWSDGDRDGTGSLGTGRGTAVLRTAKGRWVLEHWTRWTGEEDTYVYITDEQASDWLLRNNEDRAVAEYFGEIEDERAPGRPEEGKKIDVRLSDELRGAVEAWAIDHQVNRAEAIRQLLIAGLGNLPHPDHVRAQATAAPFDRMRARKR